MWHSGKLNSSTPSDSVQESFNVIAGKKERTRKYRKTKKENSVPGLSHVEERNKHQ
jgi:hypothetical protein